MSDAARAPDPASVQRPVYCRLCEARCGLLAVVTDGRLSAFEGDPQDPVSRGFVCETAQTSLAALTDDRRITTPLRRQGDQLVPASWDDAIAEIGDQLQKLRARHGARGLGLYLGAPVQRSSRTLARSLLCGVGLGTPNILSTLALDAAPRLAVTEWMLGQATPLLPDVGRAHHVVVLGDDPTETNWGPLMAGMAHTGDLEHSRRTKGTKVVVASPRRSAWAEQQDQHLAIRPGTETWFLLGMLSAIVHGGWTDDQYLRDYSVDFDALKKALAPWSVERCAGICGVEASAVSGVALKFSRAAMGVVHPGHGAFTHDMPVLGAWAWLCLHTVTANTLRPGGIYAHPGMLDLEAAIQAVRSADAPRTRVGKHPLLLLQAPATALADEALAPGSGQLRGLVCVEGDPLLDLPGSARTTDALESLDLLVCLSSWHSPATRHADWVLPIAHPWEQEDLQLLDNVLLPVDQVGLAPAVVGAPDGVRASEQILRSLFEAMSPPVRGSAFGPHLTWAARRLAGADLGKWEERLLDWVGGVSSETLTAPPHRHYRGETNRAEWRVGFDDGRIRLMPPQVAQLLAALEAPRQDPELPFLLRTSQGKGRAPDPLHRSAPQPGGVRVHPDSGLPDGATVLVTTRAGQVTATAHHDARLRPDTVEIDAGSDVDAMALLATDGGDPLTGTACYDGLACSVIPG